MPWSELFSIFWKTILVFSACVVCVSGTVEVLRPQNLNFYNPESAFSKSVRFVVRPYQDLFRFRQVSLKSDWVSFKISDSGFRTDDLLKISNPLEDRYQNTSSHNYTSLDLALPRKAVILEPNKENNKNLTNWSLVRCSNLNSDLKCEKNNILAQYVIKTSIFKQELGFIGLDENNNTIPLKKIQEINTNQRLDVKFL
jgi:hypothetical protein